MNKQAFWDIIEAGIKMFPANDSESLTKRANHIKSLLVSRPLAEIFLFQAIWNAYERIAAGSPLAKMADDIADELSGDGFDDYKAWFVIQGQTNVEAMIKEPKQMAKIAHQGYEITAEDAGYLISRALEEKLSRYPDINEDPYRDGTYLLVQDRFISNDEIHLNEYGRNWKHVMKIMNAFDENKRLYQGHPGKKTRGKILQEALDEFENDILADHARSQEP